MAVTNDMSADRRVLRHARTLQEAGHDVVVVCKEREGEKCYVDGIETVRIRVRHKRGWRFYAEYNVALWKKMRKLDADVLWANDTDTLPGCWLAARGRRLVMDVHEIFPELPEIIDKPVVRLVWATIERVLMGRCDAMLTVNKSLAGYYKRKLGVDVKVVRNEPDDVMYRSFARQAGEAHQKQPMLLYQGCVNVGRGVDWAIDALEWLPECILVVAGRGDLLEEMKDYAATKPWAGRVRFLGHVPPEELPALTKQASVGLVMLEDMGLSYHYALPNRVGDFVAAGVPMVVSDLPEMADVVRRFGVGEVIEGVSAGKPSTIVKGERIKVKGERREARALAEAVRKVLAREWHEEDFAAAREDMDWNKEKEKLLGVLECAT